MSTLSKMRKKIRRNEYSNLSPIEIEKTIKMAVKNRENNLKSDFTDTLIKFKNEHEKSVDRNMSIAYEITMVEFLNELITQMEYNKIEDEEIKGQIIDKLQLIFENSIDRINKYNNMKAPARELMKRKKKLEEFGIYLDKK